MKTGAIANSILYKQTEVGTRYFKSTNGDFAATLLKKYRRYFIRYIFEKVPTVPVLGTVIRYSLKEKIC